MLGDFSSRTLSCGRSVSGDHERCNSSLQRPLEDVVLCPVHLSVWPQTYRRGACAFENVLPSPRLLKKTVAVSLFLWFASSEKPWKTRVFSKKPLVVCTPCPSLRLRIWCTPQKLSLSKAKLVEAAFTRLSGFNEWFLKQWPEKLKTTPLQSALCHLKEALLVVSDIKELKDLGAQVNESIEHWFGSVLVEAYAIVDELCLDTTKKLKPERLSDILSMAEVMQDFGSLTVAEAMGFKACIPALRQSIRLLKALPELEALRVKSELNFKEGCFLQEEVAELNMEPYWLQVAMHFESSEDEPEKFRSAFSERLHERYFSDSMKSSLFDHLVDQQGLGTEVAELAKTLPKEFADIDSMAKVSAWPTLEVDAVIQKAQVATFNSFTQCTALKLSNLCFWLSTLELSNLCFWLSILCLGLQSKQEICQEPPLKRLLPLR